MTTTESTDYRSAGVSTPEQRSDRARRSVEAFRRMLPMLNSYARSFTGNPRLSIEVSATIAGATDGKKIYFRPPIQLGDELKHTRKLCDKRDEDTLSQLCQACDVREQVLVTIYHEIAHICYGTFNEPEEHHMTRLVTDAIAESGSQYAKQVAARIAGMPKYMTENYMGMSSVINPYMKIILNALEDARVNNQLFKARKGTRTMFESENIRVFEKGIESPQPDGSVEILSWAEREQNMQAIIGLYCAASGYDYEDWFIEPVVAALNDERIQQLVAESQQARDVAANYGISFKVLDRFRELGFCLRPDEIEDQPTEAGESDEQGEADEDGTQSGESGDSPEDEADEPGQDGEGAGAPVAGDSDGSASDHSGDDDEGLGDDSDSSEDSESDSEEHADEESSADEESGAGTDGSSDDGDSAPSGRDSGSEPEPSDEPVRHEESETDYSSYSETDEEIERESGTEEDTLDTGADLGEGGIEVVEDPYGNIKMGTPEECEEGLEKFGGHEAPVLSPEQEAEIKEVMTAIMQGQYFETPSTELHGVREHKYGTPWLNEGGENMSTAWGGRLYDGQYNRHELGIDGDFKPSEATIGKALLKMRVALADNARAHNLDHLKSGRINTRVLGRRAPLGDERLFKKKVTPGKRDYFVVIMLDISGSTVGRNLQLMKASGWAQAELLTRMGIPFVMYAYSGYYDSKYAGNSRKMWLDMYEIKGEREPWNAKTQQRLQEIGPDGGNLDGHNLEFARKICDRSTATDKIIMYHSDGKMPATNYDEEVIVLERELKTCKQRGYTVCGVGVRSDSPTQHGLPTVQIDDKDDAPKVVDFLRKMLLQK